MLGGDKMAFALHLKMEIVAEKCIYIQCKTRLNSVFELYSSNEVNLGKSRSLGSS